MARLHKIIDGRWVIRSVFMRHGLWRGRIRDKETGQMRELATRERDRRRAEQALLNWLKALERHTDPAAPPPGIRFDRAFEEWLELKDVRPITLKFYRLTFNGVYAPEFGHLLVGDIGLAEIERFLKKVKENRGVAERTRQKYLSELRSFFRWARRRRYCAEDPTDGVKVSRAAKRVGCALTHAQAKSLLKACRKATVHAIKDDRRKRGKQKWNPPPHLFLAVLIALHTGLRRGNILNLRWVHVDLTQRKITIVAEEMKANADYTVPIHPELAQTLSETLLKRGKIDPQGLGAGIKSEGNHAEL